MAVANVGNQQITFKYSTPLQADYLNIMFNDVSSEGLCSRPVITMLQPESSSVSVIISPFSMVVHPTDDSVIPSEYSDTQFHTKLVKISVTTEYQTKVLDSHVAIGFKYSFKTNEGGYASQWYGEFEPLTVSEAANYSGIIIATIMTHLRDSSRSFSISTQGADISDLLLREEGWDCNRWVSVISPRRLGAGGYNRLELRKHNDAFVGYVNGHAGCNMQNAPTVTLPDWDGNLNDYGVMMKGSDYTRYNLICHNSDGLTLAQQSDELPVKNTSGGILAVLDASGPNLAVQETLIDYNKVFLNKTRLYPCIREEINMWMSDDDTLTIC